MIITKDIPGFEGLYSIDEGGNVFDIHNNTFLEKKIGKIGYLFYGLKKDKVWYTMPIHRLLAITFLTNPYNKTQINHKNLVKTDNRLENLEWCTAAENQLHYLNHPKTLMKKEKRKVISQDKLPELKLMIEKSGIKKKYIADILDISHVRLSRWLNGHSTMTYDFYLKVMSVVRKSIKG